MDGLLEFAEGIGQLSKKCLVYETKIVQAVVGNQDWCSLLEASFTFHDHTVDFLKETFSVKWFPDFWEEFGKITAG